MNKYIALAIVLPFLLFFVLQYSLNIKITHIKDNASDIVTAACEQAKLEGYFTPEIIDKMKEDMERIGIDTSRVIVDVTTTPKYRVDEYDSREMIEYKIGIPIDKMFAASSFFGLSDDDNKTIKYFYGKLASERVRN
jgi:hypothetical protein